eukprot:20428_1
MTSIQKGVDTDLVNCAQLMLLKKSLHNYYNDRNADINIVGVLNHFLYLVNQFSDVDDNFEYIYNYLGGQCIINQCQIVKRIYINRNIIHNEAADEDIKDIARTQIMDKIHCFYIHSFDMGNRLNLEENLIADHTEHDKKNNLDEDEYSLNVLNKKILKMRDKLIYLNDKKYAKYNQLNVEDVDELYHFGFLFKYGYDGEDIIDDCHNV